MMCTKDGLEVRGFNHLRGVYANENTFLISSFRNKVVYEGSDLEDDDGIAPTRPGRFTLFCISIGRLTIFLFGWKSYKFQYFQYILDLINSQNSA